MNLSNSKISLANQSELEEIHSLINNCANELLKKGLKQWSNDYPSKNILHNDILSKTMFVHKELNSISGVIVANKIQDREYEQVKWQDASTNFIVVHRLAVSPIMQGKGIGKKLMQHVEQHAKKNGVRSVRLDTYSLNEVSLRFYKSLNYTEIDQIHLPYQSELFVCFEKIID